MPIYEFYCAPCNTIFSFLARSAAVSRQPDCPRCGAALQKQVSSFALSTSAKGPENLPLSSGQIEAGMKRFTRAMEKIKDDNPAEALRIRRKFQKMSGVSFEEDRRLTPEPTGPASPRAQAALSEGCSGNSRPERDETLYEL